MTDATKIDACTAFIGGSDAHPSIFILCGDAEHTVMCAHTAEQARGFAKNLMELADRLDKFEGKS